MRRTAFLLLMVLVWLGLLACCWRGLQAVAVPSPPQATFYAPISPTVSNDGKFDLLTLTESEALLAWADDNGLHQVTIPRRDFDRMFGAVRVEPLTPEEQRSE